MSTAAHIEIEETEMSRSGLYYTAANGQKIDNIGQRTIRALTKDGSKVAMTWQIAAIKRPLASIGKMCDAGNSAIFTKDGGYIVPEATVRGMIQHIESEGQVLKMNREDGMYNFDLWVGKGRSDSRDQVGKCCSNNSVF